MHPRPFQSFLRLSALVGVLAAYASAEPPPDLLRGPEVRTSARATGLPMLSSGQQLRAIKRQAVPVRRWFSEFGELPLTQEQRARFDSLKKAFNERSEQFKRESGQTLSRARKQLRRLEAAQDQDAPMEERDEATRARVVALQAQIKQIESSAPRVEQLQMTCWELLDQEQQDFLRAQLQQIRQQLREERTRREQRRRDDAAPMQPDAMQPDAMQPDAMQPGAMQEQRESSSE